MSDNSASDKIFLNRLTEITEANLNNPQFGVSELVKEYGKSRTYIHRKLKSITDQSISQFIRKIRLEKSLELLHQEKLTVAEIAYDVGFGSPSYFTKCFHDKFGYAPGEYKKYATENDEANRNIISELNQSAPKSLKQNSNLRKLLIPFLVTALLLVSVLYIYQSFFESEPEKSIAVLSLQNQSDDAEIQHLADGIMEDIRTRLSHISGLEVKSQISSEKYRDIKQSAREIAKELGVSYILEGSIIPDNEKIRINIQLIRAKKDVHDWAEIFDKDLKGVLEFITDVSKEVTEKLKMVLSVEETKQIEKIYTANTEAYGLYQKGRFFWHRRTEEGLNESVKYFNKALKLDSTYALAYAGLADAYFILAFWGWYPRAEGLAKGKEYALKALNLDNDLAEAHTTLGGIASHQANWEVAKKELEMAIELNPNYATAHQYYSEYFYAVGRIDEARKHIDLAIELNPNSIIMYAFSSRLCYYDGDYIESLKKGDKVLEINRNFRENNWIRFKCYIRLKKDSDAINVLHKELSLETPGINYTDTLLNIYSESGINGILLWEINRQLNRKNPYFHRIAGFYSLAGEKENAMDCLEKTYERGRSVLLFRMNSDPDFFILHDEPRFKALLKKMNLTLE